MSEQSGVIDSVSRRTETVKELLSKYPQELSWLTGSVNFTPELGGVIEADKTVGQALFPNLPKDQVKEFDRTAVGLLTFKWVLAGDYDSFTECQVAETKLSKDSFQRLHDFTKKIVPDAEAENAMEVYLVVNDLTKVTSVVEEMKRRTGETEIDHDVLLLDVLQNHKDLAPSFAALSPRYQELIVKGLGAKFNIGHLSQAEGPATILSGLKDIDQDSLNFYLVHVLFDTAGVVGHLKQNGSLVMNEPTYGNMEKAIEAISYFRIGNSEQEAYNHMLELRSNGWGLDIKHKPNDKATARIACMMRLTGEEDRPKVTKIQEVLESIESAQKDVLVHELNVSGLDGETAIMVYYGPAILANAETAFKKQNDIVSFEHSLEITLRAFAKIYSQAREIINDRKGNGLFTVMSSEVATLAGKNPQALLTSNFEIVQEGSDARVIIK